MQLGELQKRISEIKQLNGEIIAIATMKDREKGDAAKAVKSLGITFPLIPGPHLKEAEDFGVYTRENNKAAATLILDKEGTVRFKYISKDDDDRPPVSKVIEVLRGLK